MTTSSMYRKIMATRERNAQAAADESHRREQDPVEAAKTVLRRRGWNVYDERVEFKGSDNIACGRLSLTPEEVIDMAARVRSRQC